YDQLLRFAPDHADALVNRGNVLKQLSRIEEAIESYDRAIKANPKSAQAWANRALALCERLRFAEPIGNRGLALAIDPRSDIAYPDSLDDPLVSCERAIAIDDNNHQAMLVCATVLREHDRNARAVACLEGAIAFDASQADARIASCLCELP